MSCGSSPSRPLGVAAREQDDERLSAVARPNAARAPPRSPRRSAACSRPARPGPDARRSPAAACRARRATSRPASPGRGACPTASTSTRERAVVDRAGGEDDRVHVVASEQLGVAARARRRAAPPPPRRAPRRAAATATSSAPGSRWAFRRGRCPIPPRPATPSRKGRVALDTARASMAASQSLAQSIFQPGVERAAEAPAPASPLAVRRPSRTSRRRPASRRRLPHGR